MTYLQAWFFTKLNFIETTFAIISFLILAYIALLIFGGFALNKKAYYLKYIRFYIICFFCFFFGIAAFILPTQKEMAFIYIVPKLTNNESLKKITNSLPELTKQGIDYLKDSLKH